MAKREDEQKEEIKENKEKVNIRHTITAEETFTLAKDVFDLRCFIKNIYSNRAVIARRLNILTLSVSFVFTLLYAAFALFSCFTKKLELKIEITLFVMLGVYFALLIVFIIIYFCGNRTSTKKSLRIKRTLKVFKFLVRLTSLAISIVAIVLSMEGGALAFNIAVDILVIVFSIVMIVFQLLPLVFGGIGKLARWLLSPVKIKYRFSAVILEWYELAVSGNAEGAAKKVSSRYFEDIGTLIDNFLLPALGKKYINTIKPVALLNVVERADEGDRPILEGVLKNVFAYATECGYVTFDPCKDLNFSGSVEEEEKAQRPTVKDKLFGLGKKIGQNVLEKYITGSSEENK